MSETGTEYYKIYKPDPLQRCGIRKGDMQSIPELPQGLQGFNWTYTF
jgi:hypothetical protein